MYEMRYGDDFDPGKRQTPKCRGRVYLNGHSQKQPKLEEKSRKVQSRRDQSYRERWDEETKGWIGPGRQDKKAGQGRQAGAGRKAETTGEAGQARWQSTKRQAGQARHKEILSIGHSYGNNTSQLQFGCSCFKYCGRKSGDY